MHRSRDASRARPAAPQRRWLAMLATAAVALPSGMAVAQMSEQAVRGSRTGDLAALCAASTGDPQAQAALGYCQGFIVGVGQYHRALTAEGGVQRPIFCLPNPSPSLDGFRTGFVNWVRANPQHAGEPALDGLARFAAATYPCPAMPASQPRR
jgi:hypothetical protein